MSFSFAYFEGQEIEALDFYEKKLESSRQPEERSALAGMIESLRKRIMAKHGAIPKPHPQISALKGGGPVNQGQSYSLRG